MTAEIFDSPKWPIDITGNLDEVFESARVVRAMPDYNNFKGWLRPLSTVELGCQELTAQYLMYMHETAGLPLLPEHF